MQESGVSKQVPIRFEDVAMMEKSMKAVAADRSPRHRG